MKFVTTNKKAFYFNKVIQQRILPAGYQINDQESLYYLTFLIADWIDKFSSHIYRDYILNEVKLQTLPLGAGEILPIRILSNIINNKSIFTGLLLATTSRYLNREKDQEFLL